MFALYPYDFGDIVDEMDILMRPDSCSEYVTNDTSSDGFFGQ
jgi:hypothetical protein